MTDILVYVYAVGDATLAEDRDLESVVGVDETPVRVVASGRLAAVVSSVDAERFNEQALQRNLEDLARLTDVARTHHRVVDAVARHHAVVPVRLGTIYTVDANVRGLLDEHGEGFATALDRVRGRAEWGVKAFAVARPQDEPEPEGGPGGAQASGPGTAYLLRKRRAREQATWRSQQVHDAAEELHARLAATAVASHRYPPQDPRLSGRQDEMVLNAAYLADETGAAELRSTVERWPVDHIRPELTGPWAPYSFASLEGPAT